MCSYGTVYIAHTRIVVHGVQQIRVNVERAINRALEGILTISNANLSERNRSMAISLAIPKSYYEKMIAYRLYSVEIVYNYTYPCFCNPFLFIVLLRPWSQHSIHLVWRSETKKNLYIFII